MFQSRLGENKTETSGGDCKYEEEKYRGEKEKMNSEKGNDRVETSLCVKWQVSVRVGRK